MAELTFFGKQYMTHSSLSSSMVTFPLHTGHNTMASASGYDQQYGHMQCKNKRVCARTHTHIHLRTTHIHKHFICTHKNTSVHYVRGKQTQKKNDTTVTEISKSPPSQC